MTSCDGTLATTATPTTIRVVCNNTLSVALNGATSAIKVPHRTSFDAQAVKKQLGVAVSQLDGFMYRMRTLSERKVKSHEAQIHCHVAWQKSVHVNSVKSETLTFELCNAMGTAVATETRNVNAANSVVNLDYTKVATGSYFVKITSENFSTFKKINITN